MSVETKKGVLEEYLDLILDSPHEHSTEANSVAQVSVEQVAIEAKEEAPPKLNKKSVASFTTPSRSSKLTSHAPLVALEDSRRQELQALLSRQVMAATLSEPVKPKPLKSKTTVALESANLEAVNLETVNLETVNLETVFAKPISISSRQLLPKIISSELSQENTEEPVFEKLMMPEPWCQNGRPIWAQEPFHALLFKVSGLTLAVPLVTLGQIYNINKKLTPLFGQADWFMGLQESANGRIRTINTAKYVMPERYNENFLTTVKYVISIVGSSWGLAVDEVQQPTRLDPDDVTWRTDRSKRPWLAGTVKTAMCALLDIPQMGYELEKTQKP